MTRNIQQTEALKGRTILIIEDDLMILRVYTKWLTSAGATIITASDGLDGLSKLGTETVDIVLLDLGMPRLNGYETLKQIRQQVQFGDLPVVILSNTTVEENGTGFQELKQAGIKHTLKKYETSLKEIVECVNSYFPVGR